jgi:hypothetical protein
MALAMARPAMKLTRGINDIDTTAKTITYHALLVLIEDIRYVVQKEVDRPIQRLIEDRNLTISSHAISRRDALKSWNKSRTPLAWDIEGVTGANYALLSLILCVDPDAENPNLALAKKPVSYDTLAGQFVDFARLQTNQRRSAPLTKNGGFQHVLSIAYGMIAKLVPRGNDIPQYWSTYLISMMKSMDIYLIPWHKETDRAFATDVNIWVSLRQIKGLPNRPMVTVEDRIRVEAERISRENPDAPWDVPARLADMKGLWKKHTLPTCWNVRHASLPAKVERNAYVHATYDFVSEKFDGAKWDHHLALIIAILFSCVAPDICLDHKAVLSANFDPTSQIRALDWIPATSSSHKGTVAPLPFIVMMSTALIGFWDSGSPLAVHLRANRDSLGVAWTNKHGAKQINAINFIRMGLAIATTTGVKKNALLRKNWNFKSEAELKSIHDQLVEWLTNHRFGEYLAVEFVFGKTIARRLAQSKNHYVVPSHLLS